MALSPALVSTVFLMCVAGSGGPTFLAMAKELAAKAKEAGNRAFSTQNYTSALQHFTEAIQHDPSDHVFYSNRSACYASLGQYQEALEDGRKCVELKPAWVRGYARKALAEFYLGELDAAEATYRKGLELDCGNDQLKAGLEETLRKKEERNSPFANMFSTENVGKLRSHPKTAGYFQNPQFLQKLALMQQNPNMIQAFLQDPAIMDCLGVMVGLDFSQMGKEQRHREGNGPAYTPNNPQNHPQVHPHNDFSQDHKSPFSPEQRAKSEAEEEKNKGNAAYKSRQFQAAIGHYNLALELNPTEITYITNKAAAHFELGELDICLQLCEEAVERGREVHADLAKIAKAYTRKANVYLKMNRLEEAIEALKTSLEEYHDEKVKFQLKDLEKRKKRKMEEAYINPEIAEQENDRGNELFKAANFPAALDKYSEAIRRNPRVASYYANRSAAYLKLMEPMRALADANQALELDRTVVQIWARKGNIHFLMKEFHKAMDAFETGLRLEEGNEECEEGLGKVMAAISAAGKRQTQGDRSQLADPEIQRLLADPQVVNALRDMTERPSESQYCLADPRIRAAVNKLIAAGVVKRT